jgi:hypothetical protein
MKRPEPDPKGDPMMEDQGKRRVVIENVKPEIDCGLFPIKRVVGEKVVVQADIFADGHDVIAARILYRKHGDRRWTAVPMQAVENDRWIGEFIVKEIGAYLYTVVGWVDPFKSGGSSNGCDNGSGDLREGFRRRSKALVSSHGSNEGRRPCRRSHFDFPES